MGPRKTLSERSVSLILTKKQLIYSGKNLKRDTAHLLKRMRQLRKKKRVRLKSQVRSAHHLFSEPETQEPKVDPAAGEERGSGPEEEGVKMEEANPSSTTQNEKPSDQNEAMEHEAEEEVKADVEQSGILPCCYD